MSRYLTVFLTIVSLAISNTFGAIIFEQYEPGLGETRDAIIYPENCGGDGKFDFMSSSDCSALPCKVLPTTRLELHYTAVSNSTTAHLKTTHTPKGGVPTYRTVALSLGFISGRMYVAKLSEFETWNIESGEMEIRFEIINDASRSEICVSGQFDWLPLHDLTSTTEFPTTTTSSTTMPSSSDKFAMASILLLTTIRLITA